MRDFETKAKTTEEIEGISLQAIADFKYKNLHWKAKDKIRNQKWVPLKEAHKLEAENKDLKLINKRLNSKLKTDTEGLAIQLTNMTNINVELSVQRDKARKILDEELVYIDGNILKEQMAKRLSCLREVLMRN